ncbi:energy-coupled thiamine transporter ThiT [Loigolactobacillus coryniformis]|jgi:thiamine transporter|uniref:Integral membrane protein n=2 Tax=Loigolactobacillus coryniformis subsp. coryniformis TaxID=115541 RepID=A0A0R1FGH3_9LACO|nr:energy-coupled thiamine transporter ThiT [Loigolactobacillus coryniformis]MDT3392203.1 energy-coupled thiamine transporter ThiT [Bacillota bacterium]OEH89761.1 energy-coupled thiamine transporter ThiT [Loigolactobacillus coryniformis subsp. coryniformis]RRG07050.1 MAG: energy-coupled thiamine transporter ThiT [Lactobacillus sp.]ATO55245.1 energy-coupled thiamine transporter ThiT [Loigolactobacillus coryniformis subsp. coryniformis KCTC 3167 = DSM 20001]EJN56393.1 putative integral membrane 
MSNRHLLVWIEGTVIAALAMALEYLPHAVGPLNVSYGIIPLAVYSLRRGWKAGLSSGLVWGLLDLFLRGFGSGGFLNPLQGLIEYPLAFAVVGLIGFGASPVQHALSRQQRGRVLGYAISTTFFGVLCKYFLHFVAGVFYWGSYAPKGMSPVIYSLVANGGSAILNLVLVSLVVGLLLVSAPHLFMPKNVQTA